LPFQLPPNKKALHKYAGSFILRLRGINAVAVQRGELPARQAYSLKRMLLCA